MVIYCLIILTLCQGKLFAAAESLDVVLTKITEEIDPYQVTVFTHKNNRHSTDDSVDILKKILHHFPTIIVDLAKIEYSGDNRSLNIPAHKSPRESRVLYVIVQDQENKNVCVNDVLKDTFQTIVHMAPVTQRPKCLVLIFCSNKTSENSTDNILQFAWRKKFLDVTILKIDKMGIAKKIVYNPFTDLISNAYLNDEDNLFPQKLNDMNNYPFEIPAFNDPPILNLYKNKNNEIIVDGIYIKYIETFSEAVNLKISYKLYYPKSMSDKEKIYRKLNSNDINMMPIPLFASFITRTLLTLMSSNFEKTYLVILSPNLIYSSVTIPSNIYLPMLILPAIVLCFTICVKLLKFNSNIWNAIHIFQILMGVSWVKVPSRPIERVVFCTIILLSSVYIANLVSNLTNIKLIKTQRSFDTYEEIYESKLPVLMPDRMFEFLSRDGHEVIKKLKPRIQQTSDYDACKKANSQHQLSFCVTDKTEGEYTIKNCGLRNGVPIMKMSKIRFNEDNLAFPFEWGSPYVEKFNFILRKIVESGIPKLWNNNKQNKLMLLSKQEYLTTDNTTEENYLLAYVAVLIVGYLISLIVFTAEYFIYKCTRN